jgi:hypothetical protein
MWFAVLLAIGVLLAVPERSSASMIIGRNARAVNLSVGPNGMALATFRERGKLRRVLAWDAVDDDSRFKLDYAGGWGAFREPVWKTIRGCGAFDGPKLEWLVTACKASDGSYWALQSWQRMLPNQGYEPFSAKDAVWELHLSHWRGQLPVLSIYLDWVYGGKYHHLFGRYTYRGKAVHGYASTSTGVPLDPYGRNIYLDVRDSIHGPGWKRENSFLAHRPGGNFCYGFFPRPSYYDKTTRPAGHGRYYRATAIGPGVAPDPFWAAPALEAFDSEYETAMNQLGDQLSAGDRLCRQH